MAGVNDTNLAQDDPDELDAAIVSFYEALGQTDPKAIILDEKLDQKSQILMDGMIFESRAPLCGIRSQRFAPFLLPQYHLYRHQTSTRPMHWCYRRS